MNPAQTHIETEGIDWSVDDAVDFRLRQAFPGDGVGVGFCRSFYRNIVDKIVELSEYTIEVNE